MCLSILVSGIRRPSWMTFLNQMNLAYCEAQQSPGMTSLSRRIVTGRLLFKMFKGYVLSMDHSKMGKGTIRNLLALELFCFPILFKEDVLIRPGSEDHQKQPCGCMRLIMVSSWRIVNNKGVLILDESLKVVVQNVKSWRKTTLSRAGAIRKTGADQAASRDTRAGYGKHRPDSSP